MSNQDNINKSSNEIWKVWQSYKGFEQREYRFKDEMRPMFYKYLGITPDSNILDAGCGTGVFGRYLAKGLDKGQVTGFDINEGFIEHGKKRLKELSLENKVTLELADGYNLHYSDNCFDAVTNYTYIGVLSDPLAGMRELIRVCKAGGIVSCVVATQSIKEVWWQGDYPFEGADELQRLCRLESMIFTNFARQASDLSQSGEWHALRYPKMFEVCGLSDIHIHPFAYIFNYNDEGYPFEYRKNLLIQETASEIEWLAGRYSDKIEIYNKYGFSDTEFNRLTGLMKVKLEYVKDSFENDSSFEWRGGLNFIVAGRKI